MLTFFDELLKQPAPLHSEEVGPCQTAVSPDHHQVSDAAIHQVLGRLETPFPLLFDIIGYVTFSAKSSLTFTTLCEFQTLFHTYICVFLPFV